MQRIPRSRTLIYSAIVIVLAGVAVTTRVQQVVARAEAQKVAGATVQITTVTAAPDYAKPWQLKGTATSSGSGAIIDGNRILTNAHNVAWAVSIEVRRPGLQKKFPARVAHIDHGCDLALLTVDDPAFFADVSPLAIGGLPRIESEVKAYGYPVGGETVSATSGIVSRLEDDVYAHSERALLVVQIDAALNPGNSGGPVTSDGRIVAIAMQGLEDSDNIGYAIPAPMIARFLLDVSDGAVAGVPRLGLYCLPIENAAMREYLRLGRRTGALVVDVPYGSCAQGLLQRDDVILAVDGVPVANDETIPLLGDARVDLSFAIEKKQMGETASLTIWRDGAERTVSLRLGDYDNLVAAPSFPARCRYRMVGGVIFQPADMHYVNTLIESEDAYVPGQLYHAVTSEQPPSAARGEYVLMTTVLPHAVNQGYQEWSQDVVSTVQGVSVRNFAHFNELLDGATGRFIDITFEDQSRLVLDGAAARKADEALVKQYGMAADRWPSEAAGEVAGR